MMESIQKKYEVWVMDDGCEIACGLAETVKQTIFHEDAELLHTFYASTHEEAMAIYHLRMGFEPYNPGSKATECPNKCGSYYFPKGSDECPYCGLIPSKKS